MWAHIRCFPGRSVALSRRRTHPASEIRAPGAVQINEYDADNQGGFDAFTKSDEESREQKEVLKLPCLRHDSLQSISRGTACRAPTATVPRKGKVCTQTGARRGHPLVATHSQLELLVYTPCPPRSSSQVSNALVRPLTVEYAST